MRDPRPLLGEPLALDLLNTRWLSADGPRDLLGDVAGLRCWLATNDLADRCAADEKTRGALLQTRAAVQDVVTSHSGESIADLNAVLDRGRIRRVLVETGPQDDADVPRSEWLPGWLAANDLLRLLAEAPDRIKSCAHPDCILWFYDTSKNGTRRWCSMAVCGNRIKAARHHAAKRN